MLEYEIGAFSVSIRCRLKGYLEELVFSGVYGPNLRSEVDGFLGELDDLKARRDLPWCIGGDFNLVRYSHKHKGEGSRDLRMSKFREFIERWNLIDGPLTGVKFT